MYTYMYIYVYIYIYMKNPIQNLTSQNLNLLLLIEKIKNDSQWISEDFKNMTLRV